MTGYTYNSFLARLHFWLTFIGVNVTFFPMHFLGLAGMPRRYIEYPEALHGWNQVASYGAYMAGLGTIVLLVMVAEAFMKKRAAEANPWGDGATTLEWTLPSPAPFHTFEDPPRIK
jgi:cytochrome c oxidase subunit 1